MLPIAFVYIITLLLCATVSARHYRYQDGGEIRPRRFRGLKTTVDRNILEREESLVHPPKVTYTITRTTTPHNDMRLGWINKDTEPGPAAHRHKSQSTTEEYYYQVSMNRSTVTGIHAYRSALTLDWLAGEDSRQRELVATFERQPELAYGLGPTECIAHPQPPAGKVARLMLELLKNLEGDDGQVIPDLIQALIRSKLLVLETSIFETEPDFEALVKTPDVMLGEPHANFPRILGMVWITVSDPSTKKYGWCAVNKVTKYLSATRPSDIAKTMRALEPVLARARFIMEEFIQHVTPINMMRTSMKVLPPPISLPLNTRVSPMMIAKQYTERITREMPRPLPPELPRKNPLAIQPVPEAVQEMVMTTEVPPPVPVIQFSGPTTQSPTTKTPDIVFDEFGMPYATSRGMGLKNKCLLMFLVWFY